jgi:hypothetical protein
MQAFVQVCGHTAHVSGHPRRVQIRRASIVARMLTHVLSLFFVLQTMILSSFTLALRHAWAAPAKRPLPHCLSHMHGQLQPNAMHAGALDLSPSLGIHTKAIQVGTETRPGSSHPGLASR